MKPRFLEGHCRPTYPNKHHTVVSQTHSQYKERSISKHSPRNETRHNSITRSGSAGIGTIFPSCY
uniref:Uncharacterized protein n=1 Tax=Arundo donax TaxID=35708 RepID=A0A0A9FRI1_ARUDO